MSISITINELQARLILTAHVIGSYGSAERLRIKEDIAKTFSAMASEGETGPVTIEVSNAELKAWAAGCVNGWKSETISVEGSLTALTDGDRNVIRLSAKALRVWDAVKKQLPVVEDVEFEVDPEMDETIELDAEENTDAGEG